MRKAGKREKVGNARNANRNLAAVVIPVYTETLKNNEQNAIAQAIKVLGNYDIYFAMPKSLEIDYKDPRIKERRFKDSYFSSRQAYSNFMLEETFYYAFQEYKYILVYQLDAFVFSDRLAEFCAKGWDYAGAPWTHGIHKFVNGRATWYVGNGGFSLRKTESFLKWLHNKKEDISFAREYLPEDVVVAAYGDGLIIPSKEEAVCFAFEMDFDECIKRNNGKLPFGCHAWEYCEYEQWKPIMEGMGYTVCDFSCKRKNPINYAALKQANEIWNRFDLRLYLQQSGYMGLLDNGAILYGLGSQGFELYQMMQFWKIDIIAGVDNYMPEYRRRLWPIKIISNMELRNYPQTPIIITMKDFKETECAFISKGYRKNRNLFVFEEILHAVFGKVRENI